MGLLKKQWPQPLPKLQIKGERISSLAYIGSVRRSWPCRGYIILLQSGSPSFIAFVAFAGSKSSESKRPPIHSSISSCCS
jgi:hypothetical protein